MATINTWTNQVRARFVRLNAERKLAREIQLARGFEAQGVVRGSKQYLACMARAQEALNAIGPGQEDLYPGLIYLQKMADAGSKPTPRLFHFLWLATIAVPLLVTLTKLYADWWIWIVRF